MAAMTPMAANTVRLALDFLMRSESTPDRGRATSVGIPEPCAGDTSPIRESLRYFGPFKSVSAPSAQTWICSGAGDGKLDAVVGHLAGNGFTVFINAAGVLGSPSNQVLNAFANITSVALADAQSTYQVAPNAYIWRRKERS